MPAELTLADELSDDLANLLPLIRAAVRGILTPAQRTELEDRYNAALAKANEQAAGIRIGFSLAHRGRTRHTVAQAQRYLNDRTTA